MDAVASTNLQSAMPGQFKANDANAYGNSIDLREMLTRISCELHTSEHDCQATADTTCDDMSEQKN